MNGNKGMNEYLNGVLGGGKFWLKIGIEVGMITYKECRHDLPGLQK